VPVNRLKSRSEVGHVRGFVFATQENVTLANLAAPRCGADLPDDIFTAPANSKNASPDGMPTELIRRVTMTAKEALLMRAQFKALLGMFNLPHEVGELTPIAHC
jgi:hypothetical protein